ncbi:glycosyltransferase 87 family protein [Nonomuraea sp. NPDC000554]|uniref:glycosyltransferase 87 family protein n=1 Tax=Nonomuraea sp. NPDC000554 TaxID=3154259 RepID=UPI003321516A
MNRTTARAPTAVADPPPSRVARVAAPVVALVLAAQAGALAIAVVTGGRWWYAAAWVLFAAAVVMLRRVAARHVAGLVVAGGIAVVATGLLAPPSTSTDSYRYAWDGRVQAAGFSPYDHAPSDPALAPLRDGWLFPGCAQGRLYPLPGGGCTRINRPTVHTIYPPLAEVYFLAVHHLSPDGARHQPLQVGGALLALATTGALLFALRGNAWQAAYWAWCPAVPMEAVNNAHVDVLGALFVVLALGTTRYRGALLGAAIATKLLPAVALPGLLSGTLARPGHAVPSRSGALTQSRSPAQPEAPARPDAPAQPDAPARPGALARQEALARPWRRGFAVAASAGLLVAVAYLPYVLASHASVLGYLSGYVAEEGYDDAGGNSRYALLRLLLPDSWALPAALTVLAAALFHVLRHGDADRPWRGALLLTGLAFLLLTPGYSWYALLLVALVALDGRWEWLGVAAAGAASYLSGAGTLAYAGAAAAVIIGAWLRHRAGRPDAYRPGSAATAPQPLARGRSGRTGRVRPPR